MENSTNKNYYWLLIIPIVGAVIWAFIYLYKLDEMQEDKIQGPENDKNENETSGGGGSYTPTGKSESEKIRLNEGQASIDSYQNSQTGPDKTVNSFVFHVNDFGENVRLLYNAVIQKAAQLGLESRTPTSAYLESSLSGIPTYNDALDKKINQISGGRLASALNNVTINNILSISSSQSVSFGSGDNASNETPGAISGADEKLLFGNTAISPNNIDSGLPVEEKQITFGSQPN